MDEGNSSGRDPDGEEAFLRDCFAEALAPKLKLFLSVDIVGSTAFKQPLNARSSGDRDWSRYIKQFYDQMFEGLLEHWSGNLKMLEEFGTPEEQVRLKAKFAGSRPCRWKTVGDEILFWKILEHENQIWLTLDAWLKTVRDVRQWFKDEKTGLDLKCTAWIAGFPVRNRAIVGRETTADLDGIGKEKRAMPESDFNKVMQLSGVPRYPFLRNTAIIEKFYREPDWDAAVDFIGPGIDRGFRIQQFATTARMPISLDLAYLMALSVLPKVTANGDPTQNSHGLESNNIVTSKTMERHIKLRAGIGTLGTQKLFRRSTLTSPEITSGLGVHYAGDALLKGVIGGVPYPNLWIDTHSPLSLDRKKAELAGGTGEPARWETLFDFCNSFFDDRSDFLFAPFIEQPRDVYSALKSKTLPPDPDLYPYASELEAYRMSLIGPA